MPKAFLYSPSSFFVHSFIPQVFEAFTQVKHKMRCIGKFIAFLWILYYLHKESTKNPIFGQKVASQKEAQIWPEMISSYEVHETGQMLLPHSADLSFSHVFMNFA